DPEGREEIDHALCEYLHTPAALWARRCAESQRVHGYGTEVTAHERKHIAVLIPRPRGLMEHQHRMPVSVLDIVHLAVSCVRVTVLHQSSLSVVCGDGGVLRGRLHR